MAKKEIFIGSAGESRELAEKVANALSKRDYIPVRWWEHFPSGSIIIDRLTEIAKTVDGAVFLCTGVDTGKSKDVENLVPRDNVILEYGLFAGQLGREACMLWFEDGVKLPSDVAAVTHARLIGDAATTSSETIEHFDRYFGIRGQNTLPAVTIIIDPELSKRGFSFDLLPRHWHQRALWLGSQGARNWLDVVAQDKYIHHQHLADVESMLIEAVRDCATRTFVSFGPGDGRLDKAIASELRRQESMLTYIPVDISDGLLQCAIFELANSANVPVGILGDFEGGLHFIAQQLKKHGKQPWLIGLLGGTLGNLDAQSEHILINHIASFMDESDHLLLDVATVGPQWTAEKDPRFRHAEYSDAFRKFLASGVARFTSEPVNSIVSEFDERFKFEPGTSSVPETKTINFVDVKFNRIVTSVRRYQLDALAAWLSERKFNIKFKRNNTVDGIVGDGVILATRKA